MGGVLANLDKIRRLAESTPLDEIQGLLAIALRMKGPQRTAILNILLRRIGQSLTSGRPGKSLDEVKFRSALSALRRHMMSPHLMAQAGAARTRWLVPQLGRSLDPLLRKSGGRAYLRTSVDEELAEISRLTDEGVRGRTLAFLVGHQGFSKKAQRTALELAASIEAEDTRARSLGVLGARLSQPELAMAFEAANTINSPPERLIAQVSIGSNLSKIPPDFKIELGRSIEDVYTGGELPILERSYGSMIYPQTSSVGKISISDFRKSVELLIQQDLPAKSPPSPSVGKSSEATSAATATRPTPNKSARKDRLPKPRVVSAGFAEADGANRPMATTITLGAQRRYMVWVQVGAPHRRSSIRKPVALLPDEDLAAGTRIEVALFNPTLSFGIDEASARGELVITSRGNARVARQPGDPEGVQYEAGRSHRLMFPVTAPAKPGKFTLRCNLYVSQNLVQSLRVVATVTETPQRGLEDAIRGVVDYSLSSLAPTHLNALRSQRMSLMLNQSENGSVTFMFYAKPEGGREAFRREVELEAGEVQNFIEMARGALRTAAWGDPRPWSSERQYRYDGQDNKGKLAEDLIAMARAGYRIYDRIVEELQGDDDAAILQKLMRAPGAVQIALKKNPSHVFPAALIYDFDIDSNSDLTLCDTFQGALASGATLGELACFQGECPAARDRRRVCPGGFWGYRHAIGLPLTPRKGRDVSLVLDTQASPAFAVAVSVDPEFTRREAHIKLVRQTCNPARWSLSTSRDAALVNLKDSNPHLVYFYCHGGMNKDKVPYIQVGPTDSDGITRDNLRSYNISWKKTRPLVILNGCRTTALEPEAALDLVSGFIRTSEAGGVIGTEITIFEPLACSFAEQCLRRFFVDRQTIGEAVRDSRLGLLAEANPLGLVYIPYASSQLRVV